MTISVPDSAKAFIEEQAAKAGYATAADYVVSLVERERNRTLRQDVEAKLAEAVAAPSSRMTKGDWDDVRREGRRIISERKGR